MVRRVAAAVVYLGLASACSGEDPYQPTFSEAEAEAGACPNGGKVLLVDGEPQMTVCNGTDGKNGGTGAQGAKGDPGVKGDTGATGATGARGTAGSNALIATDVLGEVEQKAASIVIVLCTADSVNFVHGTGTKTTAGTVYTAQHVVEGMTSCSILSESPITTLGSAIGFTQKGLRDQVELTVDWQPIGAAIAGIAPRLSSVPAIGSFIALVGHPGLYDGLTMEHQYTTGLVTATSLQATFASVPLLSGKATAWETGWSTDAVAWHGNSGGPVFDESGEWIGMLVGAFNGAPDNEGPDLSVVIPLF